MLTFLLVVFGLMGQGLRTRHVAVCQHAASHTCLRHEQQAEYASISFALCLGEVPCRHAIGIRVCRNFRVVPAALYLEYFASDRSHMLEEGTLHAQLAYTQPPPLYACIVSPRELLPMHLSLSMPEPCPGRQQV